MSAAPLQFIFLERYQQPRRPLLSVYARCSAPRFLLKRLCGIVLEVRPKSPISSCAAASTNLYLTVALAFSIAYPVGIHRTAGLLAKVTPTASLIL